MHAGAPAGEGVGTMPHLQAIAAYLNRYLRVQDYPDDRNGALNGVNPPVFRLGLALEPCAELSAWVHATGLDALLLHRAWGIERLRLPDVVGVLAYHLPFDDHLTLGHNPRLAALLELTAVAPIGEGGVRVLGMIGDVAECAAADLVEQLRQMFGGLESTVMPNAAVVRRVAVVGAMTRDLVHEAGRRGADLYLTGQFRVPARPAVAETGIGVVAVGHTRAEQWGLRCLAGLLRERWAGLNVVVWQPDEEREAAC